MDRTIGTVNRRGLLTGAATSALLLGGAAAAEPALATTGLPGNATRRPHGVPAGVTSISSPPEPGVTYRFAYWGDLTPLNSLADGRVFGTKGVYANPQDQIGCSFDLNPGEVVHDVEFYGLAQLNTTLTAAVWASGTADLEHSIASTPVGPYAGSALHVVHLPVPTSTGGPFPHGCKLAVFVDTLPNASIQVNGIRVGFRNSPLSTVLLPTPVKVYDSATHGMISAGKARTISLSSHLPVGANGAVYTVTAAHATKSGMLEAGPAGHTPVLPACSWHTPSDRAVGSVTTSVSASRAIAVRSAPGSGKTHFTVVLTGYLV